MEIESAHIARRKNRKLLRTIVWKLLRFKEKQYIFRKAKLLKGVDVFIKQDYYKDTVEYRK